MSFILGVFVGIILLPLLAVVAIGFIVKVIEGIFS